MRKLYFVQMTKMCLPKYFAQREKCPNTEFFSDPYFPVFGPEKTPYLGIYSSHKDVKYSPFINNQ